MRPDFLQPQDQQASGDALSLFTQEPEAASPAPEPARIPGAVSIDRIVDAAPLRFVEGIAVVQALGAAVKDKGGVNAGMPDLAGIFLREGGDVVAMTPPGVEPAAPELARLLHRLVPADATPPVARLFVDRWTSGDSSDLGAFASEIAYFARPNGRELLIGLYARCAAAQGLQAQPTRATTPAPVPVAPIPLREELKETKAEEAQRPARPKAAIRWLESHKRHIFAAAAAVVLTVTATGLVTWFWPSKVAEAAPVATPIPSQATSGETAGERPSTGSPAKRPVTRTASRPRLVGAGPTNNSRSASTPTSVPEQARQEAIEQTPGAPPPAETALTPSLSSRGVPDMRIYSAADQGIDPPKLQSVEILEGLISGFPTKTNSVEVVVDAAGKVERVRMQGPPQRIPDIMILSRMKEWVFSPATRDGMAVRYRMILSWDVTP